jgi:hypothetical protein
VSCRTSVDTRLAVSHGPCGPVTFRRASFPKSFVGNGLHPGPESQGHGATEITGQPAWSRTCPLPADGAKAKTPKHPKNHAGNPVYGFPRG